MSHPSSSLLSHLTCLTYMVSHLWFFSHLTSLTALTSHISLSIPLTYIPYTYIYIYTGLYTFISFLTSYPLILGRKRRKEGENRIWELYVCGSSKPLAACTHAALLFPSISLFLPCVLCVCFGVALIALSHAMYVNTMPYASLLLSKQQTSHVCTCLCMCIVHLFFFFELYPKHTFSYMCLLHPSVHALSHAFSSLSTNTHALSCPACSSSLSMAAISHCLSCLHLLCLCPIPVCFLYMPLLLIL